ncbi:MAG: hypothetical protein CME34_03060 [Gordonia sp.]|uniref:DUF6668 family protein n=1 Tax=Gordonia sp. (in: high G+C Gram-positive bacteria) TaxID=84139 RepID=UPI000C475E28|nr:DUF6668 family protein [Gordonia sp. (in: high G+C Gram-positive bacteria)]MAU80849.1 hypothetical protein [Gordonia sp. (in: high G+C Gram-positive bacteria)]
MTDHDNTVAAPMPPDVVAWPREWRCDPLTSGHDLPPLFALVGASGGVGTTTLARMWGPAADSDTRWPANPETTQWCVLVARLSMAGIDDAAARLRGDAGPEGLDVFGIVWTPPRPGRIPKEVNRYAATIGELVDHCWWVPWIEELMLARRDAIAPWLPTSPLPDKKHSNLAAGPPLTVCTTGADIVATVTTRYRH